MSAKTAAARTGASSAKQHKNIPVTEGNVWLLLGPELGSKRAEYERIRKNIDSLIAHRNISESEIERRTFFIGVDAPSSIEDAITSYSLFAAFKIITVEQIDTAPAPAAATIARAVHNAGKDTFVIFSGDDTKASAVIEAAVPKANKKVFWQLSEADYVRYVSEKARGRGIWLHPDAAEALVYLAGEHTQELDAVISSIAQYMRSTKNDVQYSADDENNTPAHYTHPTHPVSKENIEQWTAHYRPESVFSLFDALAEGRWNNSADILASLLSGHENPVHVLAGFVYQLKIAVRLQQAVVSGKTLSAAFVAAGIRGFSIQNRYRNFISGVTLDSLQRMLCVCVKTDAAMREGYESRYHPLLAGKMMYDIIKLLRSK